ncbi:M42 family metallopeptidase [Mycoplasmopsis columbinasalis]|uniref:Aminopeptidase ysdC n=1 Tax=Mycoplasmopsis columbinasalis TaxID=114880 RepID=A0A449B9L6_9BACT|nr:M42 family metallopeptidase [Mycoplasmopsis columbinasalis]VEU77872.1 Putative aminopeptidase ysdC [Mycoplasmopsis columbinasalis]
MAVTNRIEDFKNRLVAFLETEAPSRNEQAVAQLLLKNLPANAFEVSYDNFGSVILHKPSRHANAPKVLIAAHMDEVGYQVRSIDEQGFVWVESVGGVWPSVVIGTKAVLVTSTGQRIEGVFGHTSVHVLSLEARAKALTNKELYVDFGFESKQQALDLGVQIGDYIYLTGSTVKFPHQPHLIAGKAMDNRAGLCVLVELANAIAASELTVDLYLVGTVQEEVGTRGAKTVVDLIEPDVAIALDTTVSHDTPNITAGTTKLGQGVALRMMDGGMMADPKLANFLSTIANKHDIKHYKFISMGGGTDASALQYTKGGASVITISLPQRYLRSPIGVCDVNDLLAASDLLTRFVLELNEDKYNNILKYK